MRRPATRVASRAQRGAALAAILAFGGLVALSLPGSARAASGDSYNQMTGIGLTSSAVTVKWTQGLLDANNQPINTAGSELSPNSDRSSATPTSKLSFMYNDFRNLSFSVSQTQNIGHQGITVTWTGMQPSIEFGSTVETNFMQMMECYSDSSAGPSPEDCEYGSDGLLPPGVTTSAGHRTGSLCPAGSVADVTNPPRNADGGGAQNGCDPYEPTSESPAHCLTAGCDNGTDFNIPFVPADDPSHPVYGSTPDLSQYFDEFDTNEVQQSLTGSGDTGEQQFETLSQIQSTGLGCGEVESNGQARGCWLVIVPRGTYEPNGYHVPSGPGLGQYIATSPLSASNWAQRVQIHLSYAPLQAFCPIGTQELQTVGTQVITRAMNSWQLALNKQANCTRIFSFTAVPEATTTSQLATSGSGTGMAFTTIGVGSEATRAGGHPPPLPNILYAPVAVTAMDLGFNINDGGGYVTTPVKLTPELLAKDLTQVYRTDLPDYYLPPQHPGPKWAQGNPANISDDPAFQKLNPEVLPYNASAIPLAPMLTEDHSALNQQVWQWIQADSSASSWLGGTPDTSDNVTVDPDYQALKLGKTPAIDSYPRAYTGVLDLGKSESGTEEKKGSLDLLPYSENFDSTAANLLAANDTAQGGWDPNTQAPDGTSGWWAKFGVQPLGGTFLSGASGTPDLAAYGLISAQLCDGSGANCVQPSIASVTQALNSAKKDSSGLLEINPTTVGKGGYPLVNVVYAAVPTNQNSAMLNDFADLIAFAAGQGQTTGSAPGDLPPGYLPLPANLKAEASTTVAKLRKMAGPAPTATSPAGPSTPIPVNSALPSGTGPTAAPGGTGPSHGAPGPGGPTPTPTPYQVSLPGAEPASGKTPRTPLGFVRWTLAGAGAAGTAGAGGGTLLRAGRIPNWLRRGRARP